MTRLLLLLTLAGCAADPHALPPPPLGTFCYTVAGVDTCLGASDLAATRSPTDGNIWFGVRAPVLMTIAAKDGGESMLERSAEIFGQIREGELLPTLARDVVISVPLAGTCRAQHATSPFGGCMPDETQVVCQARSVYEDASAQVLIDLLTSTEIALRFTATVDVTLLSDCCANDAVCHATEPASFSPGGPDPIEGSVHAAFTL